ncbi:MAG: DNA alkylation repair protein [Actinomycetota bacterium]|nr:DNA alkylation repair protein [Actinomycetota bacterium]
MSADALVADLARRLDARANPSTREWWNRYLKGSIEFRGVPMAGVRAAVHDLWNEHRLDELHREEQLDLVLALFAQPHAEDKLAAILALAEILIDELRLPDVSFLAEPFARAYVADWSTCDWYCVKALARFLERGDDREARARALAAWRDAPTVWQRRAAAVSFVQLAKRGDVALPGLANLVLDVCATNAHDPERFSQTSVGWVLRELSHAEPERVAAFVDEHEHLLSREAYRMATAKLPPELRATRNPAGLRR